MSPRAQGAVIGFAGGSIIAASQFGQKGFVGAVGESRTGVVLDRLASRRGGPTVIHDLRIPLPGYNANIDHAVVSGRDVTLIDSKVWRSGFYWTLGGTTRRGLEPTPHCDKRTLHAGVRGMSDMLRSLGVCARFRTPVLVVWPGASGQRPSLLLYRPQPGSVAFVARDEHHALRRLSRLTGTRSADPHIVDALSRALYG